MDFHFLIQLTDFIEHLPCTLYLALGRQNWVRWYGPALEERLLYWGRHALSTGALSPSQHLITTNIIANINYCMPGSLVCALRILFNPLTLWGSDISAPPYRTYKAPILHKALYQRHNENRSKTRWVGGSFKYKGSAVELGQWNFPQGNSGEWGKNKGIKISVTLDKKWAEWRG